MVQDLGWESLEHRRYSSWLMMIFKTHHQIVELSGATEVLQLNGAHTASNSQHVQPPATGARLFFPRTISDYRNHLQKKATDCTNIEAFRASLGHLKSCHLMVIDTPANSFIPAHTTLLSFIWLHRFYTGFSTFQFGFQPFT